MELVSFVENFFNTQATKNPDEQERFKITNDQKAAWALKKIKELETDITEWKVYYALQLKKIEENNQNNIEYFKGLLHEYFVSVPHKTTKGGQEKYELPGGELILKPESTDFTRDDKTLLEWCKNEKPEFVRTKEEPAWNDIKAHIKATGELPAGVEISTKPPEFTVRHA